MPTAIERGGGGGGLGRAADSADHRECGDLHSETLARLLHQESLAELPPNHPRPIATTAPPRRSTTVTVTIAAKGYLVLIAIVLILANISAPDRYLVIVDSVHIRVAGFQVAIGLINHIQHTVLLIIIILVVLV